MEFFHSIDAIVVLLRNKQIDEAYANIQNFVTEIAKWLTALSDDQQARVGVVIVEVNEVLRELNQAMQANNVVYIIDLIKYDLPDLLTQIQEMSLQEKT